ncbi:T9SS type B sorting domain-containing protein [bacterium]|nr:T9SS type B sorting domain-containing protein [bacterium]
MKRLFYILIALFWTLQIKAQTVDDYWYIRPINDRIAGFGIYFEHDHTYRLESDLGADSLFNKNGLFYVGGPTSYPYLTWQPQDKAPTITPAKISSDPLIQKIAESDDRNVLYFFGFSHYSVSVRLDAEDTTVSTAKPFPYYSGSHTFAKYDLQKNKIKTISFPEYFISNIYSEEVDGKLCTLGWSSYGALANKWIPTSDYITPQNDTLLQLVVIQFNQDFTQYRISPYSHKKHYYKDKDSTIIPANYSILSMKKHLLYSGQKGKRIKYALNDFDKNFNKYTIDTLVGNVKITSMKNSGNQIIFTGRAYGLHKEIKFGNAVYTAKRAIYDAFVLGIIDSDNKVKIIKCMRNCRSYNILTKQHGEVWLELRSTKPITFNHKKRNHPKGFKQIHYLKLDSNASYIAYTKGIAIEDTVRVKKSTIGDGWLHPVIINDNLIDFNVAYSVAIINNDTIRNIASTPYVMSVLSISHIETLLPPNPLFTETHNCSSIDLKINPVGADHYTVLIATDTAKHLPVDGQNYNYSPDYTLAHKLADNTRILHQGPDTLLHFYNIPSGRKYYVSVITGIGNYGHTVYNTDSMLTRVLTLPASKHAKAQIEPTGNHTFCNKTPFILKALDSTHIMWNDGVSSKIRHISTSGKYSFYGIDSAGCSYYSDTVNLSAIEAPTIDSLWANPLPPYCTGDSVQLKVITKSPVVWSTGDSNFSITATKSNTYVITALEKLNCNTKDSIIINFSNKPAFSFHSDSLISYDGSLEIDYNTSADSIGWIYNKKTDSDYHNFELSDRKYLKAKALNTSGCFVSDSLLIRLLNPVSTAFPNAFSPNGDGINDVWYCLNPDSNGVLTVFDRWGGMVYSGKNSWDGRKNGEKLPLGMYLYIFKFNENGIEKSQNGAIYLLK